MIANMILVRKAITENQYSLQESALCRRNSHGRGQTNGPASDCQYPFWKSIYCTHNAHKRTAIHILPYGQNTQPKAHVRGITQTLTYTTSYVISTFKSRSNIHLSFSQLRKNSLFAFFGFTTLPHISDNNFRFITFTFCLYSHMNHIHHTFTETALTLHNIVYIKHSQIHHFSLINLPKTHYPLYFTH